MADGLFQGLPPPADAPPISHHQQQPPPNPSSSSSSSSVIPPKPSLKSALKLPKCPNNDASRDHHSDNNKSVPVPPPALKSALKRPKSPQSDSPATVPEKRLRFKTTTDASETQIIEAMQKISSHIKNPGKFSKASKLAMQLIQAGSVVSGTSDYFVAILEAAMSLPTPCTDPSVRAGYHALFSAAQDAVENLNIKQRNQLAVWTMRAVLANDLFTDDSFVFSKACGRIKEIVSSLPITTKDDELEEVAALKEETEGKNEQDKKEQDVPSIALCLENNSMEEADPFGLDALIPSTLKKGEKKKGYKDIAGKIKREEEEEAKRFLKSRREALIACLEIAARRYKTPWCQTGIDILVQHAYDNIAKFTSQQRGAIEKLWSSIKEQQVRRKQGKSLSGKLDVNAFESLQQKYATQKISIRRAVGGSGNRRAEQWLG